MVVKPTFIRKRDRKTIDKKGEVIKVSQEVGKKSKSLLSFADEEEY
jgi:hypothetical protein